MKIDMVQEHNVFVVMLVIKLYFLYGVPEFWPGQPFSEANRGFRISR